jgi:biopolymer transport protein ExbB
MLLRRFRIQRLTAPAKAAEDAEKTAVFHYSKVKQVTTDAPRLDWTCSSECNIITSHSRGSVPVWRRPGHVQQSGPFEMQKTPRAKRLRLAVAFAVLGSALLFANPFALSARAQNAAAPAAPATTQPVAPPTVAAPTPTAAPTTSSAAPAPTAAPTSPAPAAEAPSAPANAATPAAADQPVGQTSVSRTQQLPQDLSPWGMFQDADRLVKGVLIGLAFASLVTWTVYIAKTFELRTARREVRDGLRILAKAATLAQANEQLRNGTTPVAQLMRAAAQEIRLSANARGDGLKERIAWQLERLEMATSRKISRGTGVLATVGSTAPFVGLFGTVWGIMNSFIGISNAHTTNLAVVAPGIAQALLATALGLAAAIPAVMIYNVLARQTAHYRALLGDASALIMGLVSRDLDRAKLPLAQAAE